LLAAVLAGYEAAIRVGRALGPSHYRFWHSTATAGAFGAASASAVALGLPAAGIAQALALAGTRAGGLWQVRHESSLGKSWHMAGAAREGVTAAQLAAAGLTGPLGVLEGPSGWFAATAPQADAALLTEPLAQPWLLDVSFKPWPACRHAHPAMDALREAAAGRALTPQAVQRIEVHTYEDALRFCDRPEPRTEAEARFSIQHALAAWVAWGEPQLAHYQAHSLTEPAVAALRGRVQVAVDAGAQSRYPRSYGARVRIAWRDGGHSVAELHDTHGDPARPMSPADVVRKAQTLMQAAGWSRQRIEAACAACAALPQAGELGALHAVILGENTP
jgi:2-methylcitrate dehydratase PrpD